MIALLEIQLHSVVYLDFESLTHFRRALPLGHELKQMKTLNPTTTPHNRRSISIAAVCMIERELAKVR